MSNEHEKNKFTIIVNGRPKDAIDPIIQGRLSISALALIPILCIPALAVL